MLQLCRPSFRRVCRNGNYLIASSLKLLAFLPTGVKCSSELSSEGVAAMQNAFETHFLESYDHGEWKMVRSRPAALVPDWTDQMAVISDFQSVGRSPGLFRRIWTCFERRWMRLRKRFWN